MERRRSETDCAIIKGCMNRDLSAWTAFTNRYSSLIYIAIENRLKKYGIRVCRQDIEDIRQNVLSSIWKGRKLGGVKDIDNIKYWLAVVAGNMAIVYMRKGELSRRSETVSMSEMLGERELHEVIPSADPDPYESLEKKDIANIVSAAIKALPEKERLIMKLNILHGKKYDEIARILSMPSGTVSSCIRRAKEKLKDYLKDFK